MRKDSETITSHVFVERVATMMPSKVRVRLCAVIFSQVIQVAGGTRINGGFG